MKRFALFALSLYAVATLISMAVMNLAFGVVLISFVMMAIQKKKLSFALALRLSEFHRYRFWGLLLGSACILSLILAQYFPFAYAGHNPDITFHGYEKIWYLTASAVLLSVFISSEGNEKSFRTIIQAWGYTVLALAPLAVIQFFTGWPVDQRIFNGNFHHAILLLGHHLSVASILVFPTFVYLTLSSGRIKRQEKLSLFEVAVGGAGILILFLSFARTAWLSLFIGLGLLSFRYLSKKQRFIATAGILVLCSGLLFVKEIRYKILQSDGIGQRVELWKANIDFFEHRPLTGIGWLKTQEMSEFYFKNKDPEHYHDYFWGHAHSNIFEMLGGTGLLGFLTWLGWVYFTLTLAYRSAKVAHDQNRFFLADLSWGIFVALILLHFNGLTNVTFWEAKVIHQQMLGVGMLLMIQWMLVTQPAPKKPQRIQ